MLDNVMLKITTAIFLLLVVFPTQANANLHGSKIAVSIKPIHSILSNIGYGVFEPNLILDSNSSTLKYSLTESDIQKIQNADIIILASKDLETLLQEPIEKYKENKEIIELVRIDGLKLRKSRNKETTNQTAKDTLEKNPKSIDPQIWLDPNNAIIIAKYFADVLSKHDSENAYIYKKNFIDFKEKVNLQDKAMKEKLSPYIETPFIVFDDFYQYFEKHFRLNHKGHILQPSAEDIKANRLAGIRNIIRQEKIACIFYEKQFLDFSVNDIETSLNIRTSELDSEGYGVKAGKDAYFDIINNIADNFQSCL